MTYWAHMNPTQFEDLKQFILVTVSQATTHRATIDDHIGLATNTI